MTGSDNSSSTSSSATVPAQTTDKVSPSQPKKKKTVIRKRIVKRMVKKPVSKAKAADPQGAAPKKTVKKLVKKAKEQVATSNEMPEKHKPQEHAKPLDKHKQADAKASSAHLRGISKAPKTPVVISGDALDPEEEPEVTFVGVANSPERTSTNGKRPASFVFPEDDDDDEQHSRPRPPVKKKARKIKVIEDESDEDEDTNSFETFTNVDGYYSVKPLGNKNTLRDMFIESECEDDETGIDCEHSSGREDDEDFSQSSEEERRMKEFLIDDHAELSFEESDSSMDEEQANKPRQLRNRIKKKPPALHMVACSNHLSDIRECITKLASESKTRSGDDVHSASRLCVHDLQTVSRARQSASDMMRSMFSSFSCMTRQEQEGFRAQVGRVSREDMIRAFIDTSYLLPIFAKSPSDESSYIDKLRLSMCMLYFYTPGSVTPDVPMRHED